MFRQKIAEVTDCSCRLIPSHSDQYQLFKSNHQNIKPLHKEPKQKYSLKTQTTSSSKQQNKINCAQKMQLKSFKPQEEQKISISANIDAKKQKLEKTLICSPENSNVGKLDQKVIFATNSNPNQSYFVKMSNGIKTAEANRKIDKRTLLNSHNQVPLRQQDMKDLQMNNFMSQKPLQNQKDIHSRIIQVPKKSQNFQEYYKYVSNPYSVSDRNKENIQMGENNQVSKYKIDLKMKRQMRKLRNQTMPLQEIDLVPPTQVFHESLEKYENVNHKQSRGTHNGSMATKNSLYSQPDSMKTSKNQQVSLMNSKLTNFNQNPSLQFQKGFDREDPLRENHSLVVFTQRDMNIGTQRVSRNDLKSHLVADISNCKQYLPSQIHRPYSSIENSNVRNFMNPLQKISGISCVKQESAQLFEGINKKQPPNQRIFIEKINTLNDIMNRSAECESLMGEGETNSENEESVVIMRYQDLLEETQNKADTQVSQFWLQPDHLLLNQKRIEKPGKYMLDSTKIATNVKTYGRQGYSSTGDSSISTNPYLKRTVKINREYLTDNFNHAQ